MDWDQNGVAFSGTDIGWNGSVSAGETKQVFGFIGSGSPEEPARITLNGEVCGDGGPGPSERPAPRQVKPAVPRPRIAACDLPGRLCLPD